MRPKVKSIIGLKPKDFFAMTLSLGLSSISLLTSSRFLPFAPALEYYLRFDPLRLRNRSKIKSHAHSPYNSCAYYSCRNRNQETTGTIGSCAFTNSGRSRYCRRLYFDCIYSNAPAADTCCIGFIAGAER